MQRSIRRQIVKERGQDWADFQKARYGDAYENVRHNGMRRRHYHHNPVVDRHAAKVIGFGAVMKNVLSKLFRKPSRREATV